MKWVQNPGTYVVLCGVKRECYGVLLDLKHSAWVPC